jgi:hypothetical protein
MVISALPIATLLLGTPCQPPPGMPPLAHVASQWPSRSPRLLSRSGGIIRIVLPVAFRPQHVEFSLTARDGRNEFPLRRTPRHKDAYMYPPLPVASTWSITEDATDFLDRAPDCRRRVRRPIADAVVR